MSRITDEIDFHRLPTFELKLCWVLDEITSEKKDRFSCAEITKYLVETAKFDTYYQAVKYGLKKCKGFCNSNKAGYKLMDSGRRELEKFTNRQKVFFIDANKSFTAKNYILKEIIGESYKEISLCDPYIDQNTLDVIFNTFKKGIPIRILTSKIVEKSAGMFKRQLQDLISEGYKIEVRLYKNSELHDRYILSETYFWLSGNSLNYLGKKESFLVLLGEDLRQSVLTTYNSRWKLSVTT